MPLRVSICCSSGMASSMALAQSVFLRLCAGGKRRDFHRLGVNVATAVEEAILLIVGCGLPVALDRPNLSERCLHSRPLADRVEPSFEVGIVVPLDALGIVIARQVGRQSQP